MRRLALKNIKSAPKHKYRDEKRDKTCDEADRANDEYREVRIKHVLDNQIRTIYIDRIVDNYTPVCTHTRPYLTI